MPLVWRRDLSQWRRMQFDGFFTLCSVDVLEAHLKSLFSIWISMEKSSTLTCTWSESSSFSQETSNNHNNMHLSHWRMKKILCWENILRKLLLFSRYCGARARAIAKKKQSLMIQDSNSRGLVRLSIQLFIFLHSFLNAVWVKRREMNDGRLRWKKKKMKIVS